MVSNEEIILDELDMLPINVLVFELIDKNLHFTYVNDNLLKTYNIKGNIYSDNLFQKCLSFLKDNMVKLGRTNKISHNFVYKKNNNMYAVVQNTYHLRTINDKQFVFVYSFFTTSSFMNQIIISNIMSNFTQPAFLLNNVGEVTYINDASFELLKLPKSENLTNINSYFHKLQYLRNKHVAEFIADDSVDQKHFKEIRMKNVENEEVFANFTMTKINNLYSKMFYLIIFDETVKNIISANAVKQLEKMAYYDHLCNVYNRRYFISSVNSKIQENHEHCIYMLDIDFFKSVNDTYGHLAGDEVIKVVSGISDSFITSNGGLFARYGGEEFIGYIGKKPLDECYEIAEMIRQEIEATAVYSEGKEIKVTISIGMFHTNESCSSLDDIIRIADSTLYDAKNDGRNNTKVHSQ